MSDFGHGFLGKKLIDLICKKAKFLAVNTQTNGANMGFNLITQYHNVDYIALDELEIRYAAHSKDGELKHLIKDISKRVGCDEIIITRGSYGALGYNKKKGFVNAPALATQVVDAVGAGDAFLSFTAPCIALGLPQDLVSFIGNAVGALAVQIICNRNPVDPVDLMKFITRLLK
ncbi:MAG: PfkB family carbohydrate kinase [Candidatus Saganbacteria bacterium]|nr:PfkB family carbohydrate kinase [Candidatus Saganbacteria bacterium]